MGEASYVQTSFLGGEISQWAQGRFDLPRYKAALARATNLIPVDEGAAPRRPGFRFLGTTRNGVAGRVIAFDFSEDSPYNMEFTDGYLRWWNDTKLVTTNDSQIISKIAAGTPALFSVPTTVDWQTGDTVYFTFDNPANAVIGQVLLNRQFILTMVTTTTFNVTDAITGVEISGAMLNPVTVGVYAGPLGNGPLSSLAISGSMLDNAPVLTTLSPTVNHVAQVSTPYTQAGADWHTLRSVQGLDLAMFLHGGVQPQALQVLVPPTAEDFAEFEFSPAAFQDGPYLDPPANAIATTTGQSGVIQVTVNYPAWASTTTYGIDTPVTYGAQDYLSLVNSNVGVTPGTNANYWLPLNPGLAISTQGFVATDVGRMMRLFSCPQNWNPGTTYSVGTNVTYNGSQFTSLTNSNTGNEPDIALTDWVINTSAAYYTWGTITQVLSANTVKVQIFGSPLLYTTPCPSFAIGAWSNTTGWPTSGCYQGGRFWFGGAIPNRVDSSSSNQPFIMSPTQPDGTVVDSNAISYTFNSNSVDKIIWMEPQATGILCGTKKGEYLLSSGTSGGPITPSSINDSPATKYGSSNVLPVKTGLSMCFVQKNSRRLLEYLADVFSQRFYGPDLTTFARHIGKRRFVELAYQQEPAPIVWGRMGDGSLVGTTYRRVSLFSNQEPEFNAWHQHPLGSGRIVESICTGPSSEETDDIVVDDDIDTLDALTMVTNDPSTNIRYVESMTPMMDETDPLTSAWFLDAAVTPQAASVVSYGTPAQEYVRFYGLNYLNKRKVSVFAAGLDCGDYIVNNGTVDVPIGTQDSTTGYTFDFPQFNILQPIAETFSTVSVNIVSGGTQWAIPCVIGFNYQTQGQLCRPALPQDTGAKTGPGFGKKKRTARYAINLVNSLGVQVGTDFGKMLPVPIASPGGNLPPYLSMFTGIRRETLSNDFSFDSMLGWQTTRPFPATVTNLGGFITTEDV